MKHINVPNIPAEVTDNMKILFKVFYLYVYIYLLQHSEANHYMPYNVIEMCQCVM